MKRRKDLEDFDAAVAARKAVILDRLKQPFHLMEKDATAEDVNRLKEDPMSCKRATAAESVIRFVPTFVNKDGMRTLASAAQGRNTYATAEEAQAWIDAIVSTPFNSPETLKSIWGEHPQFEVRPVSCWPVHFDPQTVWFD